MAHKAGYGHRFIPYRMRTQAGAEPVKASAYPQRLTWRCPPLMETLWKPGGNSGFPPVETFGNFTMLRKPGVSHDYKEFYKRFPIFAAQVSCVRCWKPFALEGNRKETTWKSPVLAKDSAPQGA